MEETLSCGKKPTWKWKKPCRNITDNPRYRLSPKKAWWQENQPTRHDFCSPLQVKPNTERRCHGISRSRNDQFAVGMVEELCSFHMLRPCIGVTYNPNYPFIRPLIGVTYIPGGGNSRSFLFPPRFFWEMIQFDFCIFFRWVVQLATGEVPSKGRFKTHLKVITKKCEASCRFWKTLKWFSGFSFCNLFHLYTFEALFLHCNVSPKNHPFPSISDFRFCSEFERAW